MADLLAGNLSADSLPAEARPAPAPRAAASAALPVRAKSADGPRTVRGSRAGQVERALLTAADRGAEAEAALRSALPSELSSLLPPIPGAAYIDVAPQSADSFSGGPSERPPTAGSTMSPGPPRDMPVEKFAGGLDANRVGAELQAQPAASLPPPPCPCPPPPQLQPDLLLVPPPASGCRRRWRACGRLWRSIPPLPAAA